MLQVLKYSNELTWSKDENDDNYFWDHLFKFEHDINTTKIMIENIIQMINDNWSHISDSRYVNYNHYVKDGKAILIITYDEYYIYYLIYQNEKIILTSDGISNHLINKFNHISYEKKLEYSFNDNDNHIIESFYYPNFEIKTKSKKFPTKYTHGKFVTIIIKYKGKLLLQSKYLYYDCSIFSALLYHWYDKDLFNEYLVTEYSEDSVLSKIINRLILKPNEIVPSYLDDDSIWALLWSDVIGFNVNEINNQTLTFKFEFNKKQFNIFYAPVPIKQLGGWLSKAFIDKVFEGEEEKEITNLKVDYEKDEIIMHDKTNQLTSIDIKTQVQRKIKTGYKYANANGKKVILELELPENAIIISSSNKSRTNKCIVRAIKDMNGEMTYLTTATGKYKNHYTYHLNQEIVITDFDKTDGVCRTGIHFCHSIDELKKQHW